MVVRTRSSARRAEERSSESSSSQTDGPISHVPESAGSGRKARIAADEWGGPTGSFIVSVLCPFFAYWFFLCTQFHNGAFWGPWGYVATHGVLGSGPAFFSEYASLVVAHCWPTQASFALYAAWFGFQLALYLALPGRVVEGVQLADGSRLSYKLNGFASYVVTWSVVGGAWVGWGWSPALLLDHLGPLISTALVWAVTLSAVLYAQAFATGRAAYVSGHFAFDFWMGVEKNPRWGGALDWKFFCEARPGLLLWALVGVAATAKHAALAVAAAEQRGAAVDMAFGVLPVSTLPIAVSALCYFVYVLDYFWIEDAILTTMDITTERFGWMLSFGDLVWVPFCYSLAPVYMLAVSPERTIPLWRCVAYLALWVFGWYLMRTTNNQKHFFRLNPTGYRIWGKPAQFLQTTRGTKLLLSGFWGMSRHMNYTGDLVMALAASLPAEGTGLLAFFYPVFFLVLCVHRAHRDDLDCARKYGKDWDTYKSKVAYALIPGAF